MCLCSWLKTTASRIKTDTACFRCSAILIFRYGKLQISTFPFAKRARHISNRLYIFDHHVAQCFMWLYEEFEMNVQHYRFFASSAFDDLDFPCDIEAFYEAHLVRLALCGGWTLHHALNITQRGKVGLILHVFIFLFSSSFCFSDFSSC